MTDWFDFLKDILPDDRASEFGKILIRFVNRYMQPADEIRYRIKIEGRQIEGITTASQNIVELQPRTAEEILVYAWSRKRDAFKLIEKITPKIGKPQLILEVMKTYKQKSKTEKHPKETNKTNDQPPSKPRSAPPPGPSPKDNQGVTPKNEKTDQGAPVQASERPLPDQITTEQLKNIFPSQKEDFLSRVAQECNRDLAKFKLDTILRRAHFFAQAREEAGPSLKANEESLNYTVSGLSIFSYYQRNPDRARAHGRIDNPQSTRKKRLPPLQSADQEAIGNHAYANRPGNGGPGSNGGPETGDGWRYRGRGIFQLTFKTNYSSFAKGYLDLWTDEPPDFVKNPEKVMEFPYTIRSAIWFWVANKIYNFADEGATDSAISKVTAKINPPKHRLSHRQKNFHDLTYPAFK